MRQAITVGLSSFLCSLLCLFLMPGVSYAESYGDCTYGGSGYNTNSCSTSTSPNSTASTAASGAGTSASTSSSGTKNSRGSSTETTIDSPPATIPTTHTNWKLLTAGVILIALAAGSSIWFALGRRRGGAPGTPPAQPPRAPGAGF